MRAAKHIAAAILAALLLTACGTGANSTEAPAVTEYEGFSVTRQGREMCIIDTATGEQYTFIVRRVKRPQDAAEAAERARMKTAADTDTLTAKTAYNVITVTVNTTGETYLFRG